MSQRGVNVVSTRPVNRIKSSSNSTFSQFFKIIWSCSIKIIRLCFIFIQVLRVLKNTIIIIYFRVKITWILVVWIAWSGLSMFILLIFIFSSNAFQRFLWSYSPFGMVSKYLDVSPRHWCGHPKKSWFQCVMSFSHDSDGQCPNSCQKSWRCPSMCFWISCWILAA